MAQKKKRQVSRRWFRAAGFWISIILSVVVLFIYVFSRPVFDPYTGGVELLGLRPILEIIEAKTLDLRFRLRGKRQTGDDIVIIAVDEKTDDELGRWQSSGRRWIAEMLNVLKEGGAKVAGFDVTFAEPDESTALVAVNEIKTYLQKTQHDLTNQAETFTYLEEVKHNHDYDRQLAEAIRNSGNVVLGIYHFLDKRSAAYLTPEKRKANHQIITRVKYTAIRRLPGTPDQPLRVQHSYGVEPNLSIFSEAARSFGHFNVDKDRDDYIRTSSLLVGYMVFRITEKSLTNLREENIPEDILTKLENLKEHTYPTPENFVQALESIMGQDHTIQYKSLILKHAQQIEYYPSLALEIVRTYLNPQQPPTPFIHALGKEIGGNVDHISIGALVIPTDEEGRLLINYYGPGYTFPHYSISDVVLGRIPPDTFKDKIVLFGFTSAIYQDLHSTSFQQGAYPGVEVHATIIENILRQDFLTRPEATILRDVLLIFLLGIVLGLILHRTRPISGALAAVICLISVVGITYAAFLFRKVWLNMTYPFIFVILDYVAIISYKYFTEEKKKKEVKNAFQHYVAPAIVDQMLETVDQLQLGGEQKQLTALFSDIRGFTSISEKMPPEDLVDFLYEYFSAMTKIVLDYEGTVDKYMGDAIMAFYGAPLEQPDHAVRACKTAVDMITRLKELRTGWSNQWGLPPINIGIGINSGEMKVGNMGSEERFDYTIMGDHVNLASRLEGINKQYGTNIVISQFTYEIVQNEPFIVRELDSVRVKGRQEPVTIYELRKYGEIDQQTQALLEAFNKGLDAYKNRQWDQAIASFQEALRIEPGDEPSKIYIVRCEEYKQTPPPEDWDGVFVMKTK